MANTSQQNGSEQALADYEKDLAGYLQERIKPGLSSSTIPLLARSIAKDLTRREPLEAPDGEASQAPEKPSREDAQVDEEPDAEVDEEPDAEADEDPDAEADEDPDAEADEEQPDFEANMHELQADLGEEWVLHFSVHGDDGWLTAEKQDGTQHVEAPDARRLVAIIDAIDEGGGRQP